MTPERFLVAAAAAFAGAGAFGSAVSVRHEIPGEPFGVSIPLSVPTGLLVGWGAGVAAPWPMPVTGLVVALSAGKEKRRGLTGVICQSLGLGCIAGTLIEPVTYRPRSWTPAVAGAIAGNLMASVILVAAGRRARRRYLGSG